MKDFGKMHSSMHSTSGEVERENKILNMDPSKHPEANALIFKVQVSRYSGDFALRGIYKPLDATKVFNPVLIHDSVQTGMSIKESINEFNP